MNFSHPYIAIIGLISFAAWVFEFLRYKIKPDLYVPGNGHVSKKMRFGLLALGSIGWLLLIFASSGPVERFTLNSGEKKLNDLFFVLDLSRSMLAEDFKPNRILKAKEKIKEFINLRPEDRIGMIVFGEKAFTLLPLTTDIDLIKKSIDDIEVGFLGPGTNIGDALGLATARLETSKAKNKVIVLLTDGVSMLGSMTPIQAAEIAKKMKIKVYSIGMGGNKDAKLPIQTIFGKRYQNIPGGSIDTETLKEISRLTNGKFFEAKSEEKLNEVFAEIQSLEKRNQKVENKSINKNIFYPYLVVGFIFLIFVEIYRRFYAKEFI
jgi:Ca-activated chloride channel family protein